MEIHIRPQSGSLKADNDHAYDVMWGLAAKDGVFHCECEDACAAEVPMTPTEYVGLRDRGGLVYAPGHDGAAK